MTKFDVFNEYVTNRPTNQPTDRPTNQQTQPTIEMRGPTKNWALNEENAIYPAIIDPLLKFLDQ